MVVTSNPQIAEIVEMLRKHGSKASYYHFLPGFNSRLDALQAAILRAKLKHLDNWNKLRRDKAFLYTQLLGEIGGIELPYVEEHNISSANYYTIRLKSSHISRNELRKYLESKGIATAIYHPLSLHLQKVYKPLGYNPGDFPESELAQEQVLSLPMFPELSEGQIEEVVIQVDKFLKATAT